MFQMVMYQSVRRAKVVLQLNMSNLSRSLSIRMQIVATYLVEEARLADGSNDAVLPSELRDTTPPRFVGVSAILKVNVLVETEEAQHWFAKCHLDNRINLNVAGPSSRTRTCHGRFCGV